MSISGGGAQTHGLHVPQVRLRQPPLAVSPEESGMYNKILAGMSIPLACIHFLAPAVCQAGLCWPRSCPFFPLPLQSHPFSSVH